MIEKVRLMEQRYNELSNKLSEPGIADDQKLFTDLMKEFKNLTPVVEKYREYGAVSTVQQPGTVGKRRLS